MFTNVTRTLKQAAFLSKIIILALLSLVAFTTACLTSAQQNKDSQPMKEFKHSNGLTVRVPESFIVGQSGEKLYVTAPKEAPGSRASSSIHIELRKDESLPDEAKSARTYSVSNRIIYYSYEDGGGGSGGAVYLVTAWEEVPNGYIFYDYTEQPEEFDSPSYEFCWQVIKGTSIK